MSKVHELLQKSEVDWQDLFEKMTMGFALHKVVRDKQKRVVDCVILKVNREFEKLTHRNRRQVEGVFFSKTIRTGGPEWIKRYANVVDTGKSITFETGEFEEGKYHRVHAFKAGLEMFAAVFSDITAEKNTEKELVEKAKISEILNRVMVDREIRMIELKKEIAALKRVNKQ